MSTAEQKRLKRKANPEQVREQERRYRASNPERAKEKQRRYRAAAPDRVRAERLRRCYGISLADFEAMLNRQGGQCAICQDIDIASMVVDHCHTTNAVRSLLCGRCNTALGLFGDDPARLRAAADYLERHRRV